ncbi:helix-turn-helix domain-containing protein [Laribacter hongkongensis]|uniref:Helix-turn-helix domain-containing protein n=1 Tax=Laribacter hongkongensis TaxID=168471 RepID=A0ABD4SR50_9NEIS|nr:helix-turn-helix transcriptional regulator [Laribacter hongkongensis]MCG9025472.1 helix-turn-helix domain-containing protein [Laribacter hongkongensis]
MYSIPVSTRPMQPVWPAAKAAFAVIGTILVGTGSVYGLDRTESWRHHIQPRVPFILDAADASTGGAERPDVRTASEHIESIRNVLNPAIADLAGLFDVSRQAIYKWLSGDSTPEPDKLNRIVELSRIADAFQAAGVSRAGALLKMKAFAGRSLMDLIKSGENRSEHVAALISEAKAMEASYKQSGLATSKSKSSSDWQSSISIPGSSERV